MHIVWYEQHTIYLQTHLHNAIRTTLCSLLVHTYTTEYELPIVEYTLQIVKYILCIAYAACQ